jgi:hypothetical protein
MKTNFAILVSLLFILGCKSGPPTAIERSLFNVQTNYTPSIILVTNTVTVTNEAKIPVQVPVTNFVTNLVAQYIYTPNTNAATVAETGGAIGSLFGVGGIASTALAGLFGLWAQMRSSKANKTSAVLAQIIETGGEILKTTPQGAQLADRWKTWMISHQAEQGVISQVTGLVANVVDNQDARDVAAKLTTLMGSVQNPKPPTG